MKKRILWVLAVPVFILACVQFQKKSSSSGDQNSFDNPSVEVARKYLEQVGPILGTYTDDNLVSAYTALNYLDHFETRTDRDLKENDPYFIFFKTHSLTAIKKLIESHTRAWSFDPLILKAIDALDAKAGVGLDREIEGANLAFMFWSIGRAKPDLKAEISEHTGLPFEEIKNGILFLNPKVFDGSSMSQELVNIHILSTLAHEGLHSACKTIGTLTATVENNSQIERCFNIHEKCKNSNHEGLGCDAEPWGPYTMNYLVYSEVALGCSKCSAGVLMLEAFESILKVNSLPKNIVTELESILTDARSSLSKEERSKLMFRVGFAKRQVDTYLIQNPLKEL